MTDLLRVSRMDRGRPRNVVEVWPFPVNPDLHPYAVSGAASKVILVAKCSKNGQVRAARRDDGLRQDFYHELVTMVFDSGEKFKWGNTHPYTKEGIHACLEHVVFYEFKEGVDLILHVGSKLSQDDLEEKHQKTEIHKVDWVPENCAVVVPKDRSCVGGALLVGEGYVAVAHNLCRSIAVAWDRP